MYSEAAGCIQTTVRMYILMSRFNLALLSAGHVVSVSLLNVQKCKHLPRVCHDASRSIGPYTARLQENHCSPGKLIKGEGKNVDLRVKDLAESQILSVDEMVISG
jgi:hypothetical protein